MPQCPIAGDANGLDTYACEESSYEENFGMETKWWRGNSQGNTGWILDSAEEDLHRVEILHGRRVSQEEVTGDKIQWKEQALMLKPAYNWPNLSNAAISVHSTLLSTQAFNYT